MLFISIFQTQFEIVDGEKEIIINVGKIRNFNPSALCDG